MIFPSAFQRSNSSKSLRGSIDDSKNAPDEHPSLNNGKITQAEDAVRRPTWMFVLGDDTQSGRSYEAPTHHDTQPAQNINKKKDSKHSSNHHARRHSKDTPSRPPSGHRDWKKDRQSSSLFKIPENAEPLSLIKFENLRVRGSIDSQVSRRSSGNLEKHILRRDSNDSSKSVDKIQGNENVQSRTTIAVQMKQQPIRNILTRQSSKTFRYQQMRSMIQKFINDHQLVSYFTEGEQITAPYSKQVDLSMYSDENLTKRDSLRFNAKILAIIEKWWQNIKKEKTQDGEGISRNTYISLSMAIYYVLMMMGMHDRGNKSQMQNPSDLSEPTLMEARKCAEHDWTNDSKGGTHLTKQVFFDSIFELADLWCESVRTLEYINFLDRMYKRVFEDPSLPPLLRRHLIRDPPKVLNSLDEVKKPVKRKKIKKVEKLPEIDWNHVKSIGLEIGDKEGSESEESILSDEESSSYPEEYTIPHDIIKNYIQEEKEGEKVEMKRAISPVKEVNQRVKKPKRDVVEAPQKKDSNLIKLKPSELKEIAQYLWNKEALRLIMALLRQGDEYMLEKTIFDRLLKKLESGYDDNFQSSLFQLMKENIIPERYQSVMSRMNKLNPEQFVRMLQIGLEKRQHYSDRIVLDISEVAPAYKGNKEESGTNSQPPESLPSSRLGSRAVSRATSRSGSRSASRSRGKLQSEAKQLLQQLQYREALSRMEIRNKRLEERQNSRPRTAASLHNKPSKTRWNQWKRMIEKGMELTHEPEFDETSSLSSKISIENSKTELQIQEGSSVTSSHKERRRRQRENVAKVESSENMIGSDPEDDYSMFSELSPLSENNSVISSDDSTSEDSKFDLESQEEEMERIQPRSIPEKSIVINLPLDGLEIPQSSQISLDQVKVFRVPSPNLTGNPIQGYFNNSPTSQSSSKRQSWLPQYSHKINASPRSTNFSPHSSRHSTQYTSQSMYISSQIMSQYMSQYNLDEKQNELPSHATPSKNLVSSATPSKTTPKSTFGTNMSPMVQTELTALQRHSTVSLVSLHDGEENLNSSGAKSLPATRPTSANIRVQVKKRPFTARQSAQGPKSTNFSHLSRVESFYSKEIGQKPYSPRRP